MPFLILLNRTWSKIHHYTSKRRCTQSQLLAIHKSLLLRQADFTVRNIETKPALFRANTPAKDLINGCTRKFTIYNELIQMIIINNNSKHFCIAPVQGAETMSVNKTILIINDVQLTILRLP